MFPGLPISSSSFQTSPLPPLYCTQPRFPTNNTKSHFPTLISLQPNTYPYPSIYVLYTPNTPLGLTVAVVITFSRLSQFKFYRKQPSPKKETAKNRKKLPIVSSKTLSSCLPTLSYSENVSYGAQIRRWLTWLQTLKESCYRRIEWVQNCSTGKKRNGLCHIRLESGSRMCAVNM